MSAVIDWPTVEVEPPPVAASVEPEPVELLPALQTLREHSLAELSAVERGLAKLKAEHGSTDYDISTPHGYKLATARRHAVRLVRYAVPKVVTAKRAELNEIRDAVKAEGERIIVELLKIEEPHNEKIQAEDDRRAAEKAERERIEAERKAKHEAGIAVICSYSERCAGLASDRIAAGIEQLQAIPITDGWEDFKERAEMAKTATLARMLKLHDEAKAREDEAARLEAQRIENERIAAEQEAERQRLAEAAAKVKADAEALQKRINEQAEREAAVKRDAEELHRAQLAEQEQVRADIAAAASAKIIKEHIAAVKQASAPMTPEEILPGETPLYAPLRDASPAVTFAEPEPAGDAFETLAWIGADKKPDSDRTVLCWGTEGFFCGYWFADMGGWIGCESGGTVIGVAHWSEPKGPAA